MKKMKATGFSSTLFCETLEQESINVCNLQISKKAWDCTAKKLLYSGKGHKNMTKSSCWSDDKLNKIPIDLEILSILTS